MRAGVGVYSVVPVCAYRDRWRREVAVPLTSGRRVAAPLGRADAN